MKQLKEKQWTEVKPQDAFLQRILGEDAELTEPQVIMISEGIQLQFTEVFLIANQDIPEENSYFNFYPVQDQDYYLQLSFFPEANNRSDEPYRIIQLTFQPAFFRQWSSNILLAQQPFRFDRSAEQAFTLNNSSKDILDFLWKCQEETADFLQALRRQESALNLLGYAIKAFLTPDEANKLPACSFLSNNSERDKVLEAQKIIMNNLENPLTIRELSRQVGMNECYLKKGFKAMFSKTIHEYQQFQRIERSKELLQEGRFSINEVAFRMGFGSPSHFSTSFKKIAGMKPCELLR